MLKYTEQPELTEIPAAALSLLCLTHMDASSAAAVRRTEALPPLCISLWFAQTTKHALLLSIPELHAHHCTR